MDRNGNKLCFVKIFKVLQIVLENINTSAYFIKTRMYVNFANIHGESNLEAIFQFFCIFLWFLITNGETYVIKWLN